MINFEFVKKSYGAFRVTHLPNLLFMVLSLQFAFLLAFLNASYNASRIIQQLPMLLIMISSLQVASIVALLIALYALRATQLPSVLFMVVSMQVAFLLGLLVDWLFSPPSLVFQYAATSIMSASQLYLLVRSTLHRRNREALERDLGFIEEDIEKERKVLYGW